MERTFIIPVAEEGFDFYESALPEEIQRYNAICFSRDSNINDVATEIIDLMNRD